MMKSLLLVSSLILANSALVSAAPAETVRWEYAMVEGNSSRNFGSKIDPNYRRGAELRLKGRTPIFLPFPITGDADVALLDVFNRLGSQGWELVTSPGYAGATKYIFKRRK